MRAWLSRSDFTSGDDVVLELLVFALLRRRQRFVVQAVVDVLVLQPAQPLVAIGDVVEGLHHLALGLMPSSTGMIGGRITGAAMAHYVLDDEPFRRAFAELAASGWKLNLESAKRPGAARAPNSKVKSTCPQCGGNAWAKPDFRLGCVACGVEMISVRPAVQSYEQEAA